MNLDRAIKLLREDIGTMPAEYATATQLVCDAAENAMHHYKYRGARARSLRWNNPFDKIPDSPETAVTRKQNFRSSKTASPAETIRSAP